MKKVLIGMSGGVDSSAAAIILKEQGYDVIGATMKLIEDDSDENNCCSIESVCDAKRICDKLEIPHYTLNLKKEFSKYVIENFVEMYGQAKTPNPCIECNKYLKFKYFYQKAMELNCDYIATGHYAKIEFSNKYNQYILKKAKNIKKDQSYFLYTIPNEIMDKVLFPLGDIETKDDTREILKKYDLKIAQKVESQEICFIPNNDHCKFLIDNLKEKPREGNIVDKNGNILGKHKGLIYYTTGQRKNIGIAHTSALYVIDLNKEKNEVIVGEKEDIFSKELYANELNYLLFKEIKEPIKIKARARYNVTDSDAIVYPIKKDLVKIIFDKPDQAITKGQSVVFYLDDIVLGGGKIV